MKEESPARWAPVATGAQGKSRDTREPRLSLSAVGETDAPGVTPGLSVKAALRCRARPLPTAQYSAAVATARGAPAPSEKVKREDAA